MSTPQITIPDDVLEQLIRWVAGFLHHKRFDRDSEARTRSLDLWTGFQLALAELQVLRQREAHRLARRRRAAAPCAIPQAWKPS